MDPVAVLWFIDPDTGAYRGSCPSTEGRLLETWQARLGSFRTRWEAPSRLDQRSRLATAVDTLRKGPSVGIGLAAWALGAEQPDGTRQAYQPRARVGSSTVLLHRVGIARPVDAGPRWLVKETPVTTGEFWWARTDDVLWPRPADVV